MQRTTKSLGETTKLADEVVHRMLHASTSHARIAALYGELGSGKTAFVQGAARALGISETVVSPTFIIERVYKLDIPELSHFIHIDCYRIESAEELEKLGFEEMFENKRSIVFIEWAEKVESIIPPDAVKIYFEFIDENTRKIKIEHLKNNDVC